MMKKIPLLFLFLFFGTVNFTAQKVGDSLKKRATSLIYEQPDEAISIGLKLLKSEKNVDELADLYLVISNAYLAKKNNDSSLFYNLKAENLIPKTTLPTTKIKILKSVAVQYQQMELYEKALQSLDEAQEMIDKSPKKDKEYLFNSGFINNIRGIIYLNQSNPDLALEKFKSTAESFQKLELDKETAAKISINYYNMASCYLDLKQLQQAFNYFKEGEKYAKIFDDHIMTAYNLKGQGVIYFQKHQNEESLKVLYEAEKLAEPFGDLVLNEAIFNLLANNNLAINNIEKFQIYNKKSLEIQKTLEQDDLQSYNRYLNAQNVEQEEINSKVEKKFQIYNWFAIIITLGLLTFFLKKILDMKKKNLRQKKLIETLTKSKQTL